MLKNSRETLVSRFLESANTYPDRPAVEVSGQTLTYRQLNTEAQELAATLQRRTPEGGPPLVGVFASRSAAAYKGVIGTILSGNGYVPMIPEFPAERNSSILTQSGCHAVIIDKGSSKQLDQVLSGIAYRLLIVFPEFDDVTEIAERWPQHIILGKHELNSAEDWHQPEIGDDHIAYLLFTSGSTGVPKGVVVSHQNLLAFINSYATLYEINEHDRLSQFGKLTFDASVFDLFAAWLRGACLCCPTAKECINPDKFIKKSGLSICHIVPSTVNIMKRFKALKENSYPTVRLTLFGGEALPIEVVQSWAAASSHSGIENMYGPTEATVNCTRYRWKPGLSESECLHGIVPIGHPVNNIRVMIVDENLKEVAPGKDGELLITGPQLSLGYWQDDEKTAASFVIPPGEDTVFYKTGDRVRKPEAEGPIHYLGRLDNQIKIQGNRVELAEIESVIRRETKRNAVVALGWPLTAGGAEGVVAVLEGEKINTSSLSVILANFLPGYMIPKTYIFMDRIPLNMNGKYDRQKLMAMLEKQT
jgi:amino acid adenylation domain-containing protein